MSNFYKVQQKQNDKNILSTYTIGKGLGASLLCLSVLAGCASNPEQVEQPEPAENSVQVESTATENNQQTEQAETDATDSPEVPESDGDTTSEAVDETSGQANTTVETETGTTESNAEQTPANEATPATEASIAETSTPADTAAAAATITAAEEIAPQEDEEAAPLVRSNKNLGKSYGLWTLKDAGNGFCKLKTPTLQIGDDEYSSQIWLYVEEQKVVVNAYMPLNIEHPETGIQIDNLELLPFVEKVNSTRAVITGDMTSQLSNGSDLHIYINGEEVGKKVLKRSVKLSDMKAAITALRGCSS